MPSVRPAARAGLSGAARRRGRLSMAASALNRRPRRASSRKSNEASARSWRLNRFAEALGGAQACSRRSPRESRRAVYDRRQPALSGRIPEALATLERWSAAPALQPPVPGARPLPRRAARGEPAIAAFPARGQLEPALPASWKALQTLFRMTGRDADAERRGSGRGAREAADRNPHGDQHVRRRRALPGRSHSAITC
jgi:hypothetical protein